MGKKHVVLPGQKFHNFTVIGEDEPHVTPNGTPFRRFAVRCDCGTIKSVVLKSLERGLSKSCGCLFAAPRPTLEPPPVENARWLPLTKGHWTLVDKDVFLALQGKPACICGLGKYAKTRVSSDKMPLGLHRFVLGMTRHDKSIVDHINRNTLDNRRANLRIVTPAQSAMNTGPKSKRRYKGMTFAYGKWQAKIRVDGKVISLGAYATEVEAARAYNEAAKRLHGEFAWLNPIPDKVDCSTAARSDGGTRY